MVAASRTSSPHLAVLLGVFSFGQGVEREPRALVYGPGVQFERGTEECAVSIETPNQSLKQRCCQRSQELCSVIVLEKTPGSSDLA